jgi:hypothetical protein
VNCTRIVFAVVAALATILLRHRCHHAPAQRLAIGKVHALSERQGLVVPGRAAIVLVGILARCSSGEQRRSLFA